MWGGGCRLPRAGLLRIFTGWEREDIWGLWWAALQLHMCLGNNRKDGMSLESLQRDEFQREGLAMGFLLPSVSAGRCIWESAMIVR